jgi:hypothetical protein
MAIGHALMANPPTPSMWASTYQCIPYPKWCAKYFSIRTHKHEILKKVERRPIKHQLHFILLKAWTSFKFARVARPVTEHLVSRRSANFWGVLLWISCPRRNCSPNICAPTESWIVAKDEEMSQMWPSKVEGIKWWKWKTTEHLEDYYRTPKKVFESRSIAFMVPTLFVDHKVALL